MPNGRLLIGEGLGDATVWNPQQAVQNFNNIIQTRQAKQAAEQAELAKELASVKMDGLRNDADRQSFLTKYQDLKNQAIIAQQQRDPMKKAMAKAQIQQGLLGLQDYVGRSKQAGQRDNSILTSLSDPIKRHNYTDDSVTQAIGNTKLALDDPNYKPDYTFLNRQVDHNKINEEFNKANKLALSQSQWSNPIQANDKQGNKNGVVIYNQRSVSPEQLLANQAHMYDVNDDIKQSLEQRYPQLQGANPNETKMLRLRQNALDRGDLVQDANGALQTSVTEKSRPTFKPDRAPDLYYEHRLFSEGLKDENSSPSQPTNISIPYNGGKSTVNVKGYVPLSIPNKNFAATPAYNLTTGKQVPALESSGDYSVVGVGNTPFVKNGVKAQGTIAQPDFEKQHPDLVEQRPMVHVQKKATNKYDEDEDYLIDYNKLPENVKNSKPVRQALANFSPAQQDQVNTQQPVTNPKQTIVQKVKQALTPTPKQQPEQNSGYSNIVDAKDSKGNPVQIGVKNGKWYYVKTNKLVDEPL